MTKDMTGAGAEGARSSLGGSVRRFGRSWAIQPVGGRLYTIQNLLWEGVEW